MADDIKIPEVPEELTAEDATKLAARLFEARDEITAALAPLEAKHNLANERLSAVLMRLSQLAGVEPASGGHDDTAAARKDYGDVNRSAERLRAGIAAYLQQHPGFQTAREIAAEVGTTYSPKITRACKALQADGVVVRRGTGPGSKWGHKG